MITQQGEPLAARVQQSFLELSEVASDLNSVSDEMGKYVAEIDAALKQLNLGITVWVDVGRWTDHEYDYYAEQIGYGRINGKWGVALQTVNGDYRWPEDDKQESWLFNEAPRRLRLSGIQKLPEMLRELSKMGTTTAKEIKSRLAEVKEISAAVKTVAQATDPEKKRMREGARK
jgi:hypothetical protein